MKQTKFLALVLALLMLVSLFAFVGCDNAEKPEDDTPPAQGEQNENGENNELEGENEPKPEIKKNLKVLTLGNSFSENAHRYLIHIFKEMGAENVVLGNLVVSGCDLAKHLSLAREETPLYVYYKYTLEDGQYVPDEHPAKRGLLTRARFTLARALEEEEWDIVMLQQVSGKSGIASTYGNTLDSLVNFIKEKEGEDTKFGWHMTWAYQSGASHNDFPKYSNDQMTMYNAIVDAVDREILARSDVFDFVIPTGTAVQNARTGIGDRLTKDGYHLNEKGSFIIGYTWYSVLTGDPIDEMKFVPEEAGLSSSDLKYALQSVQNAVKTPFEVSACTK